VPRGRHTVRASFSSSCIRRRCQTAVVVRNRDTGGYMLLLASWSPRASSVNHSCCRTTSLLTVDVHRRPHHRHCHGRFQSFSVVIQAVTAAFPKYLVAESPSSLSSSFPYSTWRCAALLVKSMMRNITKVGRRCTAEVERTIALNQNCLSSSYTRSTNSQSQCIIQLSFSKVAALLISR